MTKSTLLSLALMTSMDMTAQQLTINTAQRGHDVPASMYGIFFEEINHAGDGGLYAELVKNRNFEEHVLPSGMTYKDGFAVAPHSLNYEHGNYRDWRIKWDTDSLKMDGWTVEGQADYDVNSQNPLDPTTPNAMRLTLKGKGAKLINSGYWGMRIIGKENYDLRFYLCPTDYEGKVVAKVVSEKNKVLAQQSFNVAKGSEWKEFKAVLSPKSTDYKARLVMEFGSAGRVDVDYVSLFPQNTFKGRKNGMRPDVAQMIADLKPGFLRWPGGCIAEGATLENRAKWKETLGDPMKRHSEWILWNYHCTWGFGYHEFLQFCEDIGAAGMFVANVGLSCSVRNGDWTEDYEPFLQDISDAIDYATAPVSNPWGAKRAAAGHPEPFNLKYVELGNEQVGDHYAQRYNHFYRILKKKYPQITFISTLQLSPSRDLLEKADMIDPHWYVNAGFFYDNDRLFDDMERGKYTIYVGEYAAISNPDMNGALSEAAFLTGAERNSDLVTMASYAPLFQNNNRCDWPTNLIWIGNDGVMGRASYYVQQMFAQNRPTYNVSYATTTKEVNLTSGAIGFIGDNVGQNVRNVTVKDSQGKVVKQNIDLAGLKRIEQQGRGRWGRTTILNLVEGQNVNGGTIEFEARLTEQEINDSRRGDNNRLRKVTIAPQFFFGARSATTGDAFQRKNAEATNYFGINIPQIVGDRKVVSMYNATNGEANIDRNPGGGSLQLEIGQWYKVSIRLLDHNKVVVSINGNKVFEQTAAARAKQFYAAGFDDVTGETVIKVVNAADEAFTTGITINASNVEPTGKVITLAAASKTDENSMEEPKKIAPQESAYTQFSKAFNYTFQPNSFTILRIKTTK